MSTLNSQLGVVDEVTYGTAVTVTRFFEFNSFDVKTVPGNTESSAIRRGQRTVAAERFEPYLIGAEGPIVLDVPTKGFGFWLQHMLGSVSTAGPTDSNYTHTATEGTLLGKFFTAQANKPFHSDGADQAHTFAGSKLTGWELACDLDGVLVFSCDVDSQTEVTGVALATASYPTDTRVFSFAGATITIGGTSIDVKDFKVGCDLGLSTDRRYLRGSSNKKEPIENARRQYSWSCTADHDDLTYFNMATATARASKLAAVVATFDGPVAHGGTTLPQLKVTIPAARLDAADAPINGPDGLMDAISGIATDDFTNSPVTIDYRTTDATP